MSPADGTGSIAGNAPAPAAAHPVLALLGRPNSGKSSLYNAVSGGAAHVGNFPGITVDVMEAEVTLPGRGPATLMDLPGLYSLRAALDDGTDEGLARAVLERLRASGRPTVLVQVLDATQLALGLRLTAELLERTEPLLIVATQADVVRAEGRALDPAVLEAALGVPVLVVSARDADTGARVLEAVAQRLGTVGPRAGHAHGPGRWDADALARAALRERADVDARAVRRRSRTARADAILLHTVLGPAIFVGLMSALFAAVFLVADPVTAVMDKIVQALGTRAGALLGGGRAASFVTDGVLGGAGTVLAFLPQIVILTLAMELLEATGYLARGAFLVDRLLRGVGLGGRAFVPLLTAHACAVPAIAATRIMRDPRERLTTIAVLPLMTCSARIPVYSLLISAFFAGRSAWLKAGIFVSLYFAGIALGMIASLVIRRSMTRGRGLPLVLEMPAYRAPVPRAVARVCGRAAWRFVRDVGTTILVASVVLWALLTIPRPGHPTVAPGTSARVATLERSIAAGVGHALEPVTRPLGFDWRINVGLIGSFGARELMVGTLGVTFSIENADQNPGPLATRIRDARRPDGGTAYTPRTGLALMAFFVIACQCMSTLSAIRRETRTWRWPAFVLGYTYALAYVVALVTYQGARLFGIS